MGDREDTGRLLTGMAASMHHRGPDDNGVVSFEVAADVLGLSACRLAIQDLSERGHQPMESPRSGRCIAFNGEIYNAEELRTDLRRRGHEFRGHSDTEVALASFDEWGVGCLERLRGMFGLAIWDAPEGRLVLARDRLGIKPLYLHHASDGRLAFASEVRTLLATGLIAPRLDREGLESYLALGAVQDPYTLVEGVRALPAGHWAEWRGGELRTRPYWSLEDAFRDPQPVAADEAARRVREHLEEALRLHLLSDVPVGVFLSGGIDSTALVALLSQVAPEAPHTVSVVFPQRRYSEEPHIRATAERFGTRHSSVVLDETAMLREVPAAIDAMDLPTFDGVNTYVVSGAARRVGLTVAISGLGGDELFAGYPSFRDVPRLRRIRRRVPAPAGRVAGRALDRFGNGSDGQRKLASWLRRDGPDHPYALRRELFGPRSAGALLGERDGGGVARWVLPGESGDALNDTSAMELGVYMRNVLLRDADAMSMAHSLELRVPLLDHRLVEYVAGLPGSVKATGAAPKKPLLVAALRDLLPPDVATRPKMGFTLPFADWLRRDLRPTVERRLLDPDYGGQVARALDAGAVRETWDRFTKGRSVWVRPWALFVLKAWGELHLPLM